MSGPFFSGLGGGGGTPAVPQPTAVWQATPGAAYAADYVSAAIVGRTTGLAPWVGVAKAWPFILRGPGQIISVGVSTYSSGGLSPGDSWEFAIFTPDGKMKLGTASMTGAGLTAWAPNEVTTQIAVPEKFILVAMCTVSNGANYLAQDPYGGYPTGGVLAGWPGGDFKYSRHGRFPLQSDAIPTTLDGFSFNQVLGAYASTSNIIPFVAVQR